jgi:hypothetical protein
MDARSLWQILAFCPVCRCNKLRAQIRDRDTGTTGFSVYYNIQISRKLFSGSPENFTEQPFGPIPYDGAADFTRYRNSETRITECIDTIKKDESLRVNLYPLFVNCPVINGPNNPMGTGKSLGYSFIH